MADPFKVGTPVCVRDRSRREAYTGTIVAAAGSLPEAPDLPITVKISYAGQSRIFGVLSRSAIDSADLTFDIF
jgi:hypothetical protein